MPIMMLMGNTSIFCILQSIINGCLLGLPEFLHEKAVHWYYTNKPPLRNWRAYFDSPLPFWYNLLLIVASKLWGGERLSFQEIILLLTFIGSCIYATVSLTIKVLEFLLQNKKSRWLGLKSTAKRKHSHKAAIIMKIALRFRKAIFGAPSGTRTQDPLIKSQLLYQLS